jgi:hypothetical protein
VPRGFLKRRDAGRAAPAPLEPLPEEIEAAEFALKLQYHAKSSDGVRFKSGPSVISGLPTIVSNIAESPIEVVEARSPEHQQARPSLVHPTEASQWLAAHHELSPVARHAVFVLESVDALDLAVDSFAVALLHGEIDTSGYPDFGAVVGGVASHWDEVTGDLLVRAILGWGGRGVRGDTDRIARRLLASLFKDLVASQYAVGVVRGERTVPAPDRGGVICQHCGYASATERSFYCPKCGMRLLRG